jgi:hypothetical protein
MAPGCVEHGHLSNSPMRLPRRVGEQNLQPAEPLTVGAQGNHASPTRPSRRLCRYGPGALFMALSFKECSSFRCGDRF